MRIKIKTRLESAPAAEGQTLRMVRTIGGVADFQRASGWKLAEIEDQIKAADVIGIAIGTYFALTNAGFKPDWQELLGSDPDDFEPIIEPGDRRDQEADAVDPQNSRADSDPGGDEAPLPTVAPPRSKQPSRGSKNRSAAASQA